MTTTTSRPAPVWLPRLALACALAAAAAAAAGGCKAEKKRTEIILGLATDLDAPVPLGSVHLQVLRLPEGIPIGEQDFMISGNTSQVYGLPGTYAVYSEDGNPDRVRVILDGKDNNGVMLMRRTAVLTLIPERTLFVRLGVVSACQGKSDCGEGQSCIEGRCASEVIDSTRLPDYRAGLEKEIQCASGTRFADTGTKLPLPLVPPAGAGVDAGADAGGPDGGAGGVAAGACDKGVCAEGVCLGPVAGTFAAAGPMTTARGSAFQVNSQPVVLGDGKVLLAGGLGPGAQSVLSTAEVYDPATNKFAATGSLAVPRVYYGQVKLRDGRVLVAGGINDGAAALASAEIYDPATRAFSPTATPMTVPRTFPAAALLADGKVLIAGGMNQIQSYAQGLVSYFGGLDSAEIYDPQSGAFTPVTGHLFEGRAFPAVVAQPDGGALVLCGYFQGIGRTTIERFEAAAGGGFGATPTALPAGATDCTNVAALPDRKLLLTTSPNTAWVFDPAATAAAAMFVSVGPHPVTPPGVLGAVLAGGDVLFVANGTRQAYLWSATTRGFAYVAGDMSAARTNPMTALLPNGDVLIAGGGDATADLFRR